MKGFRTSLFLAIGLLGFSCKTHAEEPLHIRPQERPLIWLEEGPPPRKAFQPPTLSNWRSDFRADIRRCWELDPASGAADVALEVAFTLDRNGKVDGDVRLMSVSDADADDVEEAFQAARRAILRCQGTNGYQLPLPLYEYWKNVVITFDPTGEGRS